MQRRDFLKSAIAIAAAGLPAQELFAAPQTPAGQPFDYAWLKGYARTLATAPYVPPSRDIPDSLAKLTYDQYQSIRFKPERSLWADKGLNFQMQFFHLGRSFRERV